MSPNTRAPENPTSSTRLVSINTTIIRLQLMGFNYFGSKTPCPVCDSSATDCKCSVNGDGLHFCHGKRDDFNAPLGYSYRGLSGNGQWGMWVEEGCESGPRRHYAPRSSPGTFAAPPRIRREDSRYYAILTSAEPLCDAARSALASSLGLPESAVDAYSELRSDGHTTYTAPPYVLPEWGYDDAGAWVRVAMHIREQGGKKLAHGDPDARVKRGLTWFPDWDRGGPIYVVEGATDTLALRTMGLSAIGRPSNTGGAPTLARLLRDHPGREVVIVAENDRKPDGRWPGREGAEAVAAEVARLWGHPVRVAALAAEVKDARAWFVAHWNPGSDPLRLGPAFARAARSEVRVFRPADAPTPAPAPRVAPPEAVDRSSSFLAQMAALFASLRPSPPESDAERRLRENALAEQQAADRRDFRRFRCERQRLISQEHKATHQPRHIFCRCQKWGCGGCRCYLSAREERNAAFRFGSADSLHEFGCTKKQYDTMTKRMRRAGADYEAVREGEGYYVVCSRSIEGSIPTTPESALACFTQRLSEWDGDKRPVKTSKAWKLPRPANEDTGYANVGSLPAGTTVAEIAEVAARFGADPKVRAGDLSGRVQQTVDWIREQPWTEEDAQNFFVSCMADLGGPGDATRTTDEQSHAGRDFAASPW